MHRLWSSLLVIGLFGLVPLVGYGQAFSISPGKIEVEVAPDNSVTRDIMITNTLGRDATFKIEFEDVEATTPEEGGVKLLGNRLGRYSLKNYFLTPSQTVTIRSGESLSVPVTISLPTTVFPGSLHGGVFVSPLVDQATTTQAIPRLGVLVFVRVPGDRVEAGSLKQFSVAPKVVLGDKVPQGMIVVHNSGNTYLNPYGRITITTLLGRQAALLPIKPWFVLPESTRVYELPVPKLAPGIYRVKLELNRGYANQIDTDESLLIVLPWWLIGVGGVVLLFFVWWIVSRLKASRVVY